MGGLALTWAQASFLFSPASYLQVFLTASLTHVLPSRSFIPEEQCQGRPSQLLLQAALAHMHYLPEEPGAAGARASSYWQMAQLLQYRAVSARACRGLRSRPCPNHQSGRRSCGPHGCGAGSARRLRSEWLEASDLTECSWRLLTVVITCGVLLIIPLSLTRASLGLPPGRTPVSTSHSSVSALLVPPPCSGDY